MWEIFDRRVPRAFVILNHLAWADSFLLSIWLHFHNAVNGDTCWPIYKM
jgi:1-acyl-sn-glycerol-3-phosphate acyltransferase